MNTFTASVSKTRDDMRNHKTRTTVAFRDLKSAQLWVTKSMESLGDGSWGKIDTEEKLTGHINGCAWGRENINGRLFPRNNL